MMEASQTVKNFFMRLSEDEELRGKFEVAAKRQDLTECALLSKENGFNFTQADLEYMENLATSYQNGELTEEQLEMVSGGFVVLILMLIFGAIGIGCFSAMAAMGFSETKRGH